MKNILLIMAVCSLLMSCNRTSEEKIRHLNGYWEIKKVEPANGNPKEFPYSELVDYIEINNSEGFRKKMRPQLDGTYVTSPDQESVEVKFENDSINLYYNTPYSSWRETLLTSEDDRIRILAPDGTIYTYKRFTPYSIDHGQEN